MNKFAENKEIAALPMVARNDIGSQYNHYRLSRFQVLRSNPNGSSCTNTDALGPSSTKVAVVSILPKHAYCIERTALSSGAFPDEFPFLHRLVCLLLIETFHFLALTAHNGPVHARIQVILLNPNRGLFRIYRPIVVKRTHHFTKMTTAALLLVNLNFHIAIPSFLSVPCLGIPLLSHP
jgi:hypothetical protein